MNSIIKYILVSGASGLAGGIAGYFISKKKLQKVFDKELSEAINNEIETIREMKKTSSKSDQSDGDDISHEDIPTDTENVQNLPKVDIDKVLEMIHNEFPNEDLNEYRMSLVSQKLINMQKEGLTIDEADAELKKFIKNMDSIIEDDDEDYKDNENDEDPDYEDEGPNFNDIMDDFRGRVEVVPYTDYRALPVTFEFVTYHYFEEDDILIDDQDMIIDDMEGTVGDALSHFGEEEDDKDVVYLFNGDYGLAIEIVRFHASYAEWNGWGR